MVRIPSADDLRTLGPEHVVGKTVEEATEALWAGWQVRWSHACWADAPDRQGVRPVEATGMLMSHRAEPWWAVVSVWTGGLADGLLSPWEQRDPISRHWSLGKTVGSTFQTATAEWASSLTDLILCTRARVQHERSQNTVCFPFDEVLDAAPLSAVPELEAARVLAALRV